MKNIALIGSTGSIGTQVLNVVRRNANRFRVVALTADTNAQRLLRQAEEFRPQFIALANRDAYKGIASYTACETGAGAEALLQAVSLPQVDIAVVSVVGMCGLPVVLQALENGKAVALANKESLVAGGALVTALAKAKGIEILPIDSEHSAVWQCLRCGNRDNLKRILLTASGGPFYGKRRADLRAVTPKQATAHPNWNMGQKISVDSATMMNKGLEIIEARWLFDTLAVDYIVHPQSIVHSMVEFNDGAVLAQMSVPNMELPIQTALCHPERIETDMCALDLTQKPLTFLPPDEKNFPLPALAKQAMLRGGTVPCVLNAANEAAVQLFLEGKIGFTDITDIVTKETESYGEDRTLTLENLLALHDEIYQKLMRNYNSYRSKN